MSWFNVWDGLKNKTCRYLLQRYLGQFLEEKLNLEQLKVELYNGKATIKNVSLKVEAINELFDAQGWDVEVISGHVGVLTVIVPWNALMTHDSSIEISDVVISLRPIKRQKYGTSMLESMWSSVSSSMQLAEECMKQKDDDGSDEFLEINTNCIVGLEKFAETIDNVLNRIKAKFTNTILRLEYPSMDGSKCIAIVMKIEKFDYKNETGSENLFQNLHVSSGENLKSSQSDAGLYSEKSYLFPTFAKHNIVLSGLKLYTEEFKFTRNNLNSTNQSRPCSRIYDNINFVDSFTKIPILEMHNQQKIEIKMKQSEEISGPKVSCEVELGPIYFFLSPRQIHLLIKFWDAFFKDDAMMSSNVNDNENHLQSIRPKNIYHNLESYKTHMSGNLVNHGNWGGDYDERSLPQNILGNISSDNRHHMKSNRYCDSLSSSISSNSTITGASRFQRKIANMESCGEILNFNIIIASLIGIVLHEDILVESDSNTSDNPLNEESEVNLLHIADIFFDGIKKNPSKSFNGKNHIYLEITSLICNGSKKRNKNILSSEISLIATKFDFYEALDDGSSALIQFDRIQNCPDGFAMEPEIILNLKSTFSCSLREASNITIELSLEKNTLELDISIYDRLSSILGPSPFISKKTSQLSSEQKQNMPPKSYLDIKIHSKLLNVKLRFPVVDARPIHNADRVPWWKQNIRTDFVFISFDQFRFKFCEATMDVVANEINVYYCEKSVETKVHLLKSTFAKEEEDQLQTDLVQNYPKVTIRVPSYETLSSIKSNYPDDDCGENSEMYTNEKRCNLPFSSKRVCRESDTLHNKRDDAESETVLLPGETEEINKFCDLTMNSSKIQIRLNLPILKLVLESKQLYEIIYNRLNTDIFMWEPSSPFLKNVEQHVSRLEQSIYNVGMMDSMYIPSASSQDPYESIEENSSRPKCEKNENNLSSGSDECENKSFFGTDTSESIYFSINYSEQHKPEIKTTKLNSSDFSIEITIGNGLITAFTPVRDADNHVLPEQLGKFDIKITNLRIFSVNGFNSNENLCYLCFQLSDVELYHCGLIPSNSPMELEHLHSDIEPYMKSMFYKVPYGLTKGKGTGYNEREMVTLVIEIKKLTDQKLKRLRITTGIQQLTLRHEPAPSSHFWFNQLNDFLNILDYPIEGYKPFGIITEIQLHMWDCAIDYRPRNLAYRAVMEIGSFTTSSNIISAVTGCNLRFVVEDCVLSIAPYDNACDYPDHKITFIESIYLVPVLDVGLLDISLRLSDSHAGRGPKLDLRCSVHDAHLRTCSDSGCALAQLIAHIANDEDIISFNSEDSVLLQSSSYSDAEILSDKANTICPDLSLKQQERVNLMMAEAVKETVTSAETSNERTQNSNNHGIEVFYFPDESTKLNKEHNLDLEETGKEYCDMLNFESNVMMTSYYSNVHSEDTLPQVKMDLGDIKSRSKSESKFSVSQEEDYCIIAEEEKGFMSHCGIKNFRISDDPLRIVDNHFCLPTGKPDLLRSPESFPVAVLRYTLCEMTVTWHLYGGKDFPDNFSSTNNKKVKIETSRMSEAYKYGVSYSKGIHGIHFSKKPKENLTWKSIGGQERNHEVLVEMQFSKVRFSHEIYPTETSHASRQVLLITEIEIRDRLQSSDINKFLYYPNIKNLSNKSPQHMVVIKALHVRPNPEWSTAQECSLRISILPLRLHIDQDTLIFLADYFTNIGDNSENHMEIDNKLNKLSQTSQQNPIITVNDVPEAVQDLCARKLVSTNLDLLMDNENLKGIESANLTSHVPVNYESSPIYFREVIFSPEVPICFDYHGRRIELSRGPIAGLLMGLGQLQCSEIRLRKIIYRRGLLGFEKLLTHMCKEWLKDIKRNQLPKILSGVGPTHAFLQFFQGIYDLFWLPIEQYQKDGRIMRGLQLGAQSFSARTALAALEITSRIIQLLQFTAETAFDMVSPGPSVRRNGKLRKGKKRRPHRPKDIREGVTNAYLIMKEGINDSANTLIETAVAEHDQKGYTGAVGAVIRQIPQMVVCPAVLATQATTNILGGVKSSLVPDAKLEAREKWKDDSD